MTKTIQKGVLNMSESKRNDYGTGIPESAMEALARALLPEIRKFYECEENQAAFEKWKTEQEKTS